MSEAAADAAAARGDLPQAIGHLETALEDAPDRADLWMKLAALQRHTKQLGKALRSVDRALAIMELDFVALSFKAMLLEQLAPDRAGEAWAHALAQLPAGDLPPQLADVVARGRSLRDEWAKGREERLIAAAGDAKNAADDEESARISRFCSNISRRTQTYHSEPTDYHFPGLTEREFHPRSGFPWLEQVEAATESFASELEVVMREERAELVPYIQYQDHAPLAQWRELNRNPNWTAIHLIRNGERIDANARFCPHTMALLETLPQPNVPGAGPNAMFSLLAPNTTIPPHVGIANTRLVCHLPLIVPDGCWFRVGEEVRHWQRGNAFVFDDTIEHEAANPSDQLRVVFIFDIWHPDLTAAERDAVTRIIGAETGADHGL